MSIYGDLSNIDVCINVKDPFRSLKFRAAESFRAYTLREPVIIVAYFHYGSLYFVLVGE